WKELDTPDLLAVLGDQLWYPQDESRWADVAGLLLERAASEGDEEAVEGLLSNVGDLPNERTEREYDAILASTYARMPLLTLRALSDLGHSRARRAAEAIVTATMELYHGDFTDIGAPWPTGRVLASQITEDEEQGWELVVRAQKEFREQLNG
ncbi:MAG TPA: hypothetical protein VFI96_04450, partial [Longimicrobiaceae bacterium]|nr:hypothetical protein [Longimicrobiaceae bacterium]